MQSLLHVFSSTVRHSRFLVVIFHFFLCFLKKHLFPIEPKIFGCSYFVRDSRPRIKKLDMKSLKCVFLGYSWLHKGYRCSSPTLDHYMISRDTTFLEKVPFFPVTNTHYQGENDDFLVYIILVPKSTIEPPMSSNSEQSLKPTKPLIIHVCSRKR